MKVESGDEIIYFPHKYQCTEFLDIQNRNDVFSEIALASTIHRKKHITLKWRNMYIRSVPYGNEKGCWNYK